VAKAREEEQAAAAKAKAEEVKAREAAEKAAAAAAAAAAIAAATAEASAREKERAKAFAEAAKAREAAAETKASKAKAVAAPKPAPEAELKAAAAAAPQVDAAAAAAAVEKQAKEAASWIGVCSLRVARAFPCRVGPDFLPGVRASLGPCNDNDDGSRPHASDSVFSTVSMRNGPQAAETRGGACVARRCLAQEGGGAGAPRSGRSGGGGGGEAGERGCGMDRCALLSPVVHACTRKIVLKSAGLESEGRAERTTALTGDGRLAKLTKQSSLWPITLRQLLGLPQRHYSALLRLVKHRAWSSMIQQGSLKIRAVVIRRNSCREVVVV
jgi:hypothetical protein